MSSKPGFIERRFISGGLIDHIKIKKVFNTKVLNVPGDVLKIVKSGHFKAISDIFVTKDEKEKYWVNNWPDGFCTAGGDGHAIIFSEAIVPNAV